MINKSPLEDILKDKILHNGPITVKDYVQACLFDPNYGYYTNQTVLGKKGDFITAPEISQLFGECIAIWLLSAWQAMNMPPLIRLIECGPGKGTMLRDILSLIKKAFPDLVIDVICVEPSLNLQEKQRETLKEFSPLIWVDSIFAIAKQDLPTFIVGNEVLDVLPVQQFINGKERLITYKDGGFHFESYGSIVEVSQESEDFITHAHTLVKDNGLALFIDYGDNCSEARIGNTLSAIYKHHHCNIFEHIGYADISHQVDFFHLAKICQGRIQSQQDFLNHYGLEQRLENFQKTHPTKAKDYSLEAFRLTAPSHMGQRFLTLQFGSLYQAI